MVLDSAGDTSLLLGPEDVPPVREYNDLGRSPFLLTADHYGRLIPPAGIPIHVGCVVNNVETLVNIAAAAECICVCAA